MRPEADPRKSTKKTGGNTYAEHVAMRHRLLACCRHCNRHREIDLDALIAKYGPDGRLEDIQHLFVCAGTDLDTGQRCGRPASGFILQPDTTPR